MDGGVDVASKRVVVRVGESPPGKVRPSEFQLTEGSVLDDGVKAFQMREWESG